MSKYVVKIEELITETREYEVEADSPIAAAAQARVRWVDNGEEPGEGQMVGVQEREYRTRLLAGPGDDEVFDEDEIVNYDPIAKEIDTDDEDEGEED